VSLAGAASVTKVIINPCSLYTRFSRDGRLCTFSSWKGCKLAAETLLSRQTVWSGMAGCIRTVHHSTNHTTWPAVPPLSWAGRRLGSTLHDIASSLFMVVLAASSHIHSPLLGDKVHYGIALSYRPAPAYTYISEKQEIIFGTRSQKESNKISKLVKMEEIILSTSVKWDIQLIIKMPAITNLGLTEVFVFFLQGLDLVL
jgi:hypothetical protein